MMEPLFHPKAKLLIDTYLNSLPHSLLIVAPPGSGKLHRALWLAKQANLTPIHVTVQEGKKLIGIEQIQQLYTQTRSGSPTMVIIEDAELMSTDAQNALLKLLEEPPAHTHFILTATSQHSILATIRSRCQVVVLVPPSAADIQDYVAKHQSEVSSTELNALITTTQGCIGRLMSVLTDGEAKERHLAIVAEAKQFYTTSPYERLTIAQSHELNRTWALELLDMLSVIIDALIDTSTNDPERLRKLERHINEVERAATALKQAGNPKVHLSRLALAL